MSHRTDKTRHHQRGRARERCDWMTRKNFVSSCSVHGMGRGSHRISIRDAQVVGIWQESMRTKMLPKHLFLIKLLYGFASSIRSNFYAITKEQFYCNSLSLSILLRILMLIRFDRLLSFKTHWETANNKKAITDSNQNLSCNWPPRNDISILLIVLIVYTKCYEAAATVRCAVRFAIAKLCRSNISGKHVSNTCPNWTNKFTICVSTTMWNFTFRMIFHFSLPLFFLLLLFP